jgi:hypothetical protein
MKGANLCFSWEHPKINPRICKGFSDQLGRFGLLGEYVFNTNPLIDHYFVIVRRLYQVSQES